MKTDHIKINLAKQHVDLLKSVFKDNLVSAFLFGSVVRGEDTKFSDIDLMAILKKPPTINQLKKLGKPGRFDEIRGVEGFQEISCIAIAQDRFLELLRKGAPREAINPLREAVVLYDTGFISGLKKDIEAGVISLKKDAYLDYLRYGDIRRSCLMESIIEKNTRNARSDAAASASHYLRAYFLHKYNEMIFSKELLKTRIKEENREIATRYERIIERDYDNESVDAIREWVTENICKEKPCSPAYEKEV